MKNSITIVPTLKLKWKGIFSMDELYKNMKYWLDYEGFGDEEKTFQEEKYVERLKGGSKQLEIRWYAQKNISDYFGFVIKVGFFVLGLKDIEIETEGKKIGSQKGEVEMRISSELIIDREEKWNSKTMQNIYEKFIIKDRLEDYKTELYSKTYSFHDEIKEYLTMHQH
jgi:hypothetical protein|tara:strand:- start:938 stop:1441 length:504 start_codon:yes stop_codon:yes gene_type:complete